MKRTTAYTMGFALIELIISMAAASILLAALGLGLSQTRRPMETRQTVLGTQMRVNQLNSHLQRYLPRAIAITELTSDALEFTCQDPATTYENIKTFGYDWSQETQELWFTDANGARTVLADYLSSFNIAWGLTNPSLGVQYVRVITINYQFQAETAINRHIIISLSNLPESPASGFNDDFDFSEVW